MDDFDDLFNNIDKKEKDSGHKRKMKQEKEEETIDSTPIIKTPKKKKKISHDEDDDCQQQPPQTSSSPPPLELNNSEEVVNETNIDIDDDNFDYFGDDIDLYDPDNNYVKSHKTNSDDDTDSESTSSRKQKKKPTLIERDMIDELGENGFNDIAQNFMANGGGDEENPVVEFKPLLLPRQQVELRKRKIRQDMQGEDHYHDDDKCLRCTLPDTYDSDDEDIYSKHINIVLKKERDCMKRNMSERDIAIVVSKKYNKTIQKRAPDNGHKTKQFKIKWSPAMLEKHYLERNDNIPYMLSRRINFLAMRCKYIEESGMNRQKYINEVPIGQPETDISKDIAYNKVAKLLTEFVKMKQSIESEKQKLKIIRTKENIKKKSSFNDSTATKGVFQKK
jgi:hypothetical protein